MVFCVVVETSSSSAQPPARGSSSQASGARPVEACSMYGQTIQQQPVCVLLKAVSSGAAFELSVDVKSSDSALVGALVDELKQLVLALPPVASSA